MSADAANAEVIDNKEAGQFEIRIGDEVAFIAYELRRHIITINHTEVPPSLEGQGIGSKLARAALDDARSRGLTVVPACPFVRSYLAKHPEYEDVIDRRYQSE